MEIEFIIIGGAFTFLILTLLFLHLIIRFRKKIALNQIDFYNSLIQCEISERKRMAKEIHDGIGGLLGMAKFHLSNLNSTSDINPNQLNDINNSIKLIDLANEETRNISNILLPASIGRFGLNGAIEDLIKIYKPQFQIQLCFDCCNEIPNSLQANLYRIISELLNNSRKHSKCSNIEIDIITGANKLILHYSDNGVGFDFNHMKNNTQGNGLINIENRVTLLNGKVIHKNNNGSIFDFEFQL
jgi:signal transduction histidine kinase